MENCGCKELWMRRAVGVISFAVFVAASMPGAIEELPLFGKRRSSLRRSARATVATADGKGKNIPGRCSVVSQQWHGDCA